MGAWKPEIDQGACGVFCGRDKATMFSSGQPISCGHQSVFSPSSLSVGKLGKVYVKDEGVCPFV